MRIRELRAEARNALKGNLMKVALSIFYSLIIPFAFGMISTTIAGLLYQVHALLMIVAVVAFVVGGIYLIVYLSYGVTIAVMKISRNEESHYFKDAFSKENRKLATSAFGGLVGKLIGWFLLAMFAPIIPFVGVFISIAAMVMCVIESYNYMLINYLKYDYQDKPVKELLEKSKMMMNGNKAKAMVIPMTLIGWTLLNYIVTTVISAFFSFIWGPFAMPIWVTILEYVISFFLSSMLTAYLNMINYQLYMEQKPLEIYNDDYLKPETNAKKYIWITIGVLATVFIIYSIIMYLMISMYMSSFVFDAYNM